MSTHREFDIILFGATGFTGALVAQRLAAMSPLRWAIAGRNADKLRKVADSLSAFRTSGTEPPAILIADAASTPDLLALADRTRVIVSTVGPYARHGSELVAACVERGTHYCDLTGEVPWVRKMIDQHHQAAQRAGACIVHCCGFDSIPSDMSVWLLQQALHAATGQSASDVVGYFSDLRGGASGGTIDSMRGVVDAAVADKGIRRLLANPFALVPSASVERDQRYQEIALGIDRPRSLATAPFLMSSVNSRVVYRSASLLADNPTNAAPYGTDFAYREGQSFPLGVRNMVNAAGMTAVAKGLLIAFGVPFLRKIVDKRLPAVGTGPSAKQRERGRYTFTAYGEAGGQKMSARFSDIMDPGYGSTSKMLAAAATCLAFDKLSSTGGVVTPSVAMGNALSNRLQAAGITIYVDNQH
jgi:short subunit dehydrogenase-like uncharacterized protein